MFNQSNLQGITINGVASVVPGFGTVGKSFGELVSTEEIVHEMLRPNKDDFGGLGSSFVREKMGIESVALTDVTLDFCRQAWRKSQRNSRRELFHDLIGRDNKTIYAMLAAAIKKSIASVSKGDGHRIFAHIHVVTGQQHSIEFELHKLRGELGIYTEGVFPTYILQQGCAGLFSALRLAEVLLGAENSPLYGRVLVTAENNMMTHAHQRAALHDRPQDIDAWIWPAIFGEGVGAMLVESRNSRNLGMSVGPWQIDAIEEEVVENEWRVRHVWDEESDTPAVLVKSAAVKQTYLKNIAKHSKMAIVKCDGIENVFRFCLHESNPKLVLQIADRLNIPHGRVPSISAKTGTLACVSAFTLIDLAIRDFEAEKNPVGRKIALGLIGESCGSVRAGHMSLSPLADSVGMTSKIARTRELFSKAPDLSSMPSAQAQSNY